jgi:DNA-3-methyladenine glycosylase
MSSRRRRDALGTSFFARPAEIVARDLLGMTIVSTIGGIRTAGRIVETEAYVGPDDDASHAAARIGRTARNDVMFGPPGVAYVYRIYGVHWCLNAVTDTVGFPAAVLIRAVEPLHNLIEMKRRRGIAPTSPDRMIASGPGKLAAALGITGADNGHTLDRAPLWIEQGEAIARRDIVAGPRIGITKAVDLSLRFHERGSPWISRA